MIERLTSKKNLNDAYWQVYRNKGAAGVDRLSVTELKSQLQTHSKRYIQQIERESYQVSPILGVEIPKSNGRKRLLGIPTWTGCFNRHCTKYCSPYSSQTSKSTVMGSDQNAMHIRQLQRALRISIQDINI